MKRLLYIASLFIGIACTQEIIPGGGSCITGPSGFSSEISPAAYVKSTELPPAATKAMINVSTVSSLEANALRIDEEKDNEDRGTYRYGTWEEAYLVEATVSSPTARGLRSMSLNPVQAYSYKVEDQDTTFYHTRMVSWYPRTCTLFKNDEGKASVMRFSDFQDIESSAYSVIDGKVVLNFKNLDGNKDVMVSNIVEGQHWHSNDGDEHYTYPFGQNDSKPTYTNYLTYKHYLSAVKIYAYADKSEQVVSMWGNIRNVIVRNQPSQISVALPSPSEMEDASVADYVQNNSLDYGTPTFSGNTDFPLIKTPMYETETNGSIDEDIVPDSPTLVQGERIYLGYALIKPNVQDGQKLEFDVHTDADVLSLSVPMTQYVEEGGSPVRYEYFQPGYIYTVDVNFNTEGAIADIVMQSGQEHYYDLSASKELSETVSDYQYANSYIVHPEIRRYLNEAQTDYTYYDGYAFLATTVGSATSKIYPEFASDRTTKNIEPVRAGLLWESSPGLVTQVEYLYGYVRFKVQPPKEKNANGDWVTNSEYKEGNAVIAAYDSQRKVIWSWHIWVTDKPSDVSYVIGNKTITLLDRNLGATAATTSDGSLLDTYGLYYQWGRKDPSMGPPDAYYRPQSTATMEYYDYYGMTWNYAGIVTKDRPGIRDGVENPMYLILPTDFSMTTYQYDWMYTNIDNLWGDYNEKTIYDPCPFDYMVPQDEISTLFASQSVTHVTDKGMTINNSFFPFAGYKGVDKGVSSLSGAWRYVGSKGDYMSAKIESNGHRSRTYISDDYSWTEYGADADNDGDGDASRTYNSYIFADDMANRRTAASVRCVKMNYGLGSSLNVSFVGNRAYAFVGDGQIDFAYSIAAQGSGVAIESAAVDLNGNEIATIAAVGQDHGIYISGNVSFNVPSAVGSGLARYRLVSNASNGVVSRVSHALRMFDVADLKVNDADTTGCTYNLGEKYKVSFKLKGLESDFTVVINGVQATKGTVTTTDGLASMPYSVSGVNIPGHIHIQIIDAEGGLACEKSYEVKMASIDVEYQYIVDTDNHIKNVDDLEAGGLYVMQLYNTYYNNYYCISSSDDKQTLSWTQGTVTNINPSDVDPKFVFYFHRDDTKKGGVTGYNNVCAGAWKNVATGQFVKEDFTFGSEADAVYMTIANKNANYAEFFLRDTGTYFCYIDGVPSWHSWAHLYQYPYRWRIYPVTATPK